MSRFLTVAEIASAIGLSRRTVQVRADREGWRHRAGLARPAPGRGGGHEFALHALPADWQARIASIANDDRQAPGSASKGALWSRYEGLNADQKAECARRLQAIETIERAEKSGLKRPAAIHAASRAHEVSERTLRNWLDLIAGVKRSDRLAALAPDYKATASYAEIDPRALDAIKSDLLRPEAPAFTAAYRRMASVAKEHGWSPVPAERALRRRLRKEIPEIVWTVARQGRDKAKALYPAQRRSRAHLHAMQAVTMDGHTFDVFVQFDGQDKPARAHLIALQDLFSGKIVAWRLAQSENKDAVRLAIGDMVTRHGIPETIVLDNGRAFASKWISGQAPNRYRFKVRDEDPKGLLVSLGTEIVWAKPYSGQSKPIERAFRDLGEDIARHPFCAGAYTGNRPEAKPENYASKAIPFEAFKAHVARGIAEHNARPGRRTETAAGRSFDETFAASLADPSSLIRWPSEAQRALWLMAAERVKVRKGTAQIHLMGNVYWAGELVGHQGRHVTVRFDPDDLSLPLVVYDGADKRLCEASPLGRVNFLNSDAARDHEKLRGAFFKNVREQHRLHAALTPNDLADLYGGGAPAPEPKPEPPRFKRLATGGAVATVEQWTEEDEDAFGRAVHRLESAQANIIEFRARQGVETAPVSTESGAKKTAGDPAATIKSEGIGT